jgi:hypothetical protein
MLLYFEAAKIKGTTWRDNLSLRLSSASVVCHLSSVESTLQQGHLLEQ